MTEAQEKLQHVIEHLEVVYGVPTNEDLSDPLAELIETILSQATSSANSRRAFANLQQRFPTWDQVRRARPAAIETAIKCGGLARQKSRRIKTILNQIYEQRGSLDLSFLHTCSLAEAVAFLQQFTGVGPKTVGCVLLFACQRPVFPMDTHILRITRRLSLIPPKGSAAEAHRLMLAQMPEGKHYATHINLIRHGRRICRPTAPKCDQCCLVAYCDYQTVL